MALYREAAELSAPFTPQSGLHPVNLDVYRGSEFAPGQIPHRSFTAVVYPRELAAEARTCQLGVPAFAPRPQIQSLLFSLFPADIRGNRAIAGNSLSVGNLRLYPKRPIFQRPVISSPHRFSLRANIASIRACILPGHTSIQ